MFKESISKMGRKELEQLCEKLSANSESMSGDLEIKDRHIKHLTANARNWSKRYYADLEAKTAETINNHVANHALETDKALMNAETENAQLQDLITRVNESNVELMKKLQGMQAKLKTSEMINTRLEERLAETIASAPPPRNTQPSSLKKPLDSADADEYIMEFSQEMQQTLAKYAA